METKHRYVSLPLFSFIFFISNFLKEKKTSFAHPSFADWVWRQRDQYREYRNGQPSTLTTTRIAKLTELGFEFIAHDHHGNPIYHDPDSQLYSVANTEKARLRKGRASVAKQRTSKPMPKSRFKEGKWLESLAKVVAYKEEHGTCNVPRKWKKDPTL